MGETIYNMLSILLANYYDPNNIFQGFQNNFVPPSNGQWVTITELDTTSFSYPLSTFSGTVESSQITTDNLDVTPFQLDFYGKNARNCCAWTRLYVQSADGTNYLAATGGITVYKIEQMRNLTNTFDQDKYLPRFMLRFSLFNNNTISYGQDGFTSVDLGLIRVP